jgi:hypothetical protein
MLEENPIPWRIKITSVLFGHTYHLAVRPWPKFPKFSTVSRNWNQLFQTNENVDFDIFRVTFTKSVKKNDMKIRPSFESAIGRVFEETKNLQIAGWSIKAHENEEKFSAA